MIRLERYQAQFLYLHKHGISTVEQLMERQSQIEQEIQQRTELRQPLYAKRRCETDEKIKEELAVRLTARPPPYGSCGRSEHSANESNSRFPVFSRTYGSSRKTNHKIRRRLSDMSTSGETADLMVREGIQITESASSWQGWEPKIWRRC